MSATPPSSYRRGRARASSIGEYIAAAPPASRKHLRELRAILRKVAPHATEAIKWGNPVFEEKRILFAFSAFRTHLNFMPTPSAMKPFAKELARLKTGRVSIQLPYDKPLPKALLRRIAALRVRELREKDVKWM
jgi:uncharacterized protein YdhG (YjbR/CyaY superfamily)